MCGTAVCFCCSNNCKVFIEKAIAAYLKGNDARCLHLTQLHVQHQRMSKTHADSVRSAAPASAFGALLHGTAKVALKRCPTHVDKVTSHARMHIITARQLSLGIQIADRIPLRRILRDIADFEH
ncbi:hypothetical protein NDU88_002294 [Pleurodeles waltl]|uniref:Uncharacterized protein n=1 Tax=Pleurodeles waltl TaxID=8319 RepID=A0AAV7W1S4_PLEWA|nr:hypothetical protein NDU88_002294 [Pleurodeles waltl]